MSTRRLARSWLVAGLLAVAVGGCALVSRTTTSTEFIDHASGEGWYLSAGGGFYELAGPVDLLLLPSATDPVDADYVEDSQFFGSFDLSRDGQFIVAESTDRARPEAGSHLIIYDVELQTIYENETNVRHDGYSAYRWSPDRSTVSFAHVNDIILLDVATGEFRTIATNHKEVVRDGQPHRTPSWSADSRHLTFESIEGDVMIVDVATGEQERIDSGFAPVWSPDGAFIAYHDGGLGDRTAKMYEVSEGSTNRLFRSKFGTDLIWTPDSRYLVFRRGYANTIYGDLLYYSFAEGKVFDTGLKIATIDHGSIVALPAEFSERLRPRAETQARNPNRLDQQEP